MIQGLRRGFFFVLSFFSCYVIFINIYGSWSAPPPQTRLDRLQTDLVLQALTTDWVQRFISRDIIDGIYRNALQEYQEVKDQSLVVHEVGLLLVKNDRIDQAQQLWQQQDPLSGVLAQLWQVQPAPPSNSADLIKQNLEGWYEYFALRRFYQIVKPESVPVFELQQTIEAEAALLRLVIINLIPVLGSVTGGGILLFYFIKLRKPDRLDWSIPWNLEILGQVLVSWFSAYTLISQFLPPLLRSVLTNAPSKQALIIAISYLAAMMPMVGILMVNLRAFSGWHKTFNFPNLSFRAVFWALGGYLAAIPLVVTIALIQQLILRGRGGGNPLLEIISQGQNGGSILLFWFTLGVSAPLFEELLFRGFLFPSLAKYIPGNLALWGSAFLFALVHMNINDLLPLTLLGLVLGTVYDRSRSLFTPILLHSLWNTGSFVSLLLISF